MDKLLACRLPKSGKVKMAPMLGHDGRLKGDLTCFNWGNDEYWLMGSYYLREFHMRWFNDHMEDNVSVEDISDAYAGFAVAGPNARAILEKVSDTDLSSLKMMNCTSADLGLHRVRVSRLSLSGEMAYEINCAANEQAQLRRLLLDAGADLAIKEVGFASMLSMRLEKGIGIWNAEFTQAYTPAMTGLDRWIAWDKGDFIGKAAAQSAPKPDRVLTMLEVDADNADASGFEPVWQGDKLVGMTTSGGFGHRVGKSLALALVDRELAEPGNDLAIHVVGENRGAKTIEMSPYDPDGSRMRA
tara:strand:- start:309 stop:1208 length:900 start_codon:yes stop_codon:yes gene_type:complete